LSIYVQPDYAFAHTEGLVRVPVDLGAAPVAHQILDCQAVELLVVPQHADDVPAQAVDIDPAAGHPVLLRQAQEGLEGVVVQLVALDPLVGEVDDGDLAQRVQTVVLGGISVILRVHARLCARLLPVGARRRLVLVVLFDRVRARYAAAQRRRVDGGAVWREHAVAGSRRRRRHGRRGASAASLAIQLRVNGEVRRRAAVGACRPLGRGGRRGGRGRGEVLDVGAARRLGHVAEDAQMAGGCRGLAVEREIGVGPGLRRREQRRALSWGSRLLRCTLKHGLKHADGCSPRRRTCSHAADAPEVCLRGRRPDGSAWLRVRRVDRPVGLVRAGCAAGQRSGLRTLGRNTFRQPRQPRQPRQLRQPRQPRRLRRLSGRGPPAQAACTGLRLCQRRRARRCTSPPCSAASLEDRLRTEYTRLTWLAALAGVGLSAAVRARLCSLCAALLCNASRASRRRKRQSMHCTCPRPVACGGHAGVGCGLWSVVEAAKKWAALHSSRL
jgi:hypothetical protein